MTDVVTSANSDAIHRNDKGPAEGSLVVASIKYSKTVNYCCPPAIAIEVESTTTPFTPLGESSGLCFSAYIR